MDSSMAESPSIYVNAHFSKHYKCLYMGSGIGVVADG